MIQTEQKPRLCQNLQFSSRQTPEGTVFVVKDPATERFFQFREIEYVVARQLDGSTPLEVIGRRVEEKLGVPAASATLEQFVQQLRSLGLLEAESPAGSRLPARPKRWAGSLLYLRIKAFDPDRLLGRLAGILRFLFTPSFLVVSAAGILAAAGITAANWTELGRHFTRLYRFEVFLLAWLTILTVTVAHEFAHGLTCKHFGGDVHEMGFMLIYFQPAFYCNVSDAWLFREKSKRLWVSFAGAYFEVFLWALAALAWRLTEPDAGLNFMALVVMATSGIKTLFNLNPLLKLDGYYLLSDWLEIPNLRQKAFRFLKARLWGRRGSAADGEPAATPREQWTYFLYGALAGGYSLWLLGHIVLWFVSSLVGRYQGWGFALFCGLLLMVFRKRLVSILPRSLALLGPDGRARAFVRRRAVGLGVLAVILAALFLVPMELKVSGEFKVLPAHNADVRAEVEGIIQEIYVDEGDVVRKGDLIARLSERDYRAELEEVTAEIAEKGAKLRMLRAGPRREEIQVAKSEVETAKTRYEYALRRFDEAKRMRAERLSRTNATVQKAEDRLKYALNEQERFRALFEAELIARRQLEAAEEQAAVRSQEREEARAELDLALADDLAEVRKELAVAEKEQTQAQARLELLLAGSRPEEIEATEAEINRLEAERNHLEEQLQLLRVASPVSGVVTTPELKEKFGEHVSKGDLIAKVHELKIVRAETAIPEKEIADVEVGQKVLLKARSHPEKTFVGSVTAIAPAAASDEQGRTGQVIRVTTEIDNTSGLLKAEMTGNAKIFCGKRRIADLLTRRLVRYLRVEFWSWW